jgi:hypothetical protein
VGLAVQLNSRKCHYSVSILIFAEFLPGFTYFPQKHSQKFDDLAENSIDISKATV